MAHSYDHGMPIVKEMIQKTQIAVQLENLKEASSRRKPAPPLKYVSLNKKMKEIIPKEDRIRGVPSISSLEKANPKFLGKQNVDYYIGKLLMQQEQAFKFKTQLKLAQKLN